MRADFEDSQQSLPHIHSSWGVGNGGGLSCLLNFSTTVVSFTELLIHLSLVGHPYPGGGYFQVHLGWKLHSSFPRRKVAPGEKTLYSLESKER